MSESSKSTRKFLITERTFSEDESKPSIGLANLHAEVPGIEQNKDKMLRAIEIFKEKGANFAVFPEFCLSGYFWEDEPACRRYMDSAVIENHGDWIEKSLKPLLGGTLRAIVFNNLRKGDGGRYVNTTFILSNRHDHMTRPDWYNKTFLPGIEKTYTDTGGDNRLVIDTQFGRMGFTTCYDFMFAELLLKYVHGDHVDAIVQLASWRAMAERDYPMMNVKTDVYYGYLWDLMMASRAASHQVWVIACNAVGEHGITGSRFWGGSGIWAPSGLPLVQASHFNEELLIAHNVDIMAHREFELDDFNYAMDFREIYRVMQDQRTHSNIEF